MKEEEKEEGTRDITIDSCDDYDHDDCYKSDNKSFNASLLL